MMIFNRDKQKQLEEFGATIEKAIEDIGVIVQFPDNLDEVSYSDEPYVGTKYDSPRRTYTLEIIYRDDGNVRTAKKEKLNQYRKQLSDEMKRIGDELDGMV